MKTILSEKLKINLRLSWRFYLINCLFFWAIGLIYINTMPWPPSIDQIGAISLIIIWLGILSILIGHLALLAVIPTFILPFIFQLIIPKPKIVTLLLNSLIGTFAVMLLLADSLVFTHYRFHINGFFLHIFFSSGVNQFFDFSQLEWILMSLILFSIFLIELIASILVYKTVHSQKFSRHNLSTLSLLIGSLLISWAIIFLPAITPSKHYSHFLRNQAILTNTRLFPLSAQVSSILLAGKFKKYELDKIGHNYYHQPAGMNFPLNYPLHPLQFSPRTKHNNIVIILIDAWRPDMVKQNIMPIITRFAQNNLFFQNHVSGGNATRPGTFSLFYALPSNYFNAMLRQHRAPLFMDTLRKENYSIGIFSSAPLLHEQFDKTLFLKIRPLMVQTPGKTPRIRDDYITKHAIKFINQAAKTKKLFFTFLFYDSLHSYCENNKIPEHFKPQIYACDRLALTNHSNPIPYLNRYKNAAYYIDGLVNQVLITLEKNHIMKNTIVILTGDHGEEFNDTHTDSWGHASNFTRFQIQPPLIIHWPGKKAEVIKHQTTHYDILPTLMKQTLGYQNPFSDYSIGQSLFDNKSRPFIIAGSYIDYAVIQPNKITVIGPTGNIYITTPLNKIIQNAKPDTSLLQNAWQQIRKFYKKN